jgi:transposase
MTQITAALIGCIRRVGVDLAKNVIQLHAVDGAGRRVVARAIKRDQFLAWCAQLRPGCVVAMEACSGAHAWARRLTAMGVDARLIAASFVSPYRMEGKTGKNDMTEAAAVCEAASRPTMRFVPIKTAEQQGVMMLHRMREGFKEERTACINRIRGVLAEFDLVFGKSPKALRAVLADVIEDASNELTALARLAVQQAYEHWRSLDEHMRWCDQRIGAHVRSSPAAQRAAKVLGIGRDRRLGPHGRGGRVQAVQEWPPVRCLARYRAQPKLQRRQSQTGAHHQARRRLPAHAAHPRRQVCGHERGQTR